MGESYGNRVVSIYLRLLNECDYFSNARGIAFPPAPPLLYCVWGGGDDFEDTGINCSLHSQFDNRATL